MSTYKFPLTPMETFPVTSGDPNRVYRESATAGSPLLQSRRKAEQLARANGTTVLDRATPTWTADQIIAVICNGDSEIATFMHDQPTFNSYQGDAKWVNGGANGPDYKTVKFVKFVGANALAGLL